MTFSSPAKISAVQIKCMAEILLFFIKNPSRKNFSETDPNIVIHFILLAQ